MNEHAIEDIQGRFGIPHELCMQIRSAMQSSITLGYIPGTIIHHFHGTLENKDMNEIGHYLRHWHNTYNLFELNEQDILIPLDTNEARAYCDEFMQYVNRRNIEPQLVLKQITEANVKTYIRARMTDPHSTPLWGPLTWTLLHTLAQKWKQPISSSLIACLNTLLRHTPCEMCSKHSNDYLNSHEFSTNSIKDQNDLITFLFTFHNNINRMHGKPQFNVLRLESTYSTIPFRVVYDLFRDIYRNDDMPDQLQALDDIKAFFSNTVLDGLDD
jgi:hypothetical protein